MPTDLFRCRACGRIWLQSEVIRDVYNPSGFVCGDVCCGAVVDKVKGETEDADKQCG
jgi:hypothetical protein